MSDAQLYRSKDEVEDIKIDPITQVLDYKKDQNMQLKREITAIEKRVKARVQECVDFAEESDYPPVQQLYEVYEQENYPFIPHKL
jgi:pyruvate dehydrogenase E1 component alpha subunit